MSERFTVEELRARGWTIPDGLAIGDITAHWQARRPLVDRRRDTIEGVAREEMIRHRRMNEADLCAVMKRLSARDDAEDIEHLATIGVAPPPGGLWA